MIYGSSWTNLTHDGVVDYRCYERTVLNVGWSDDMVRFHALRDGVWCYPEMGAYQALTN